MQRNRTVAGTSGLRFNLEPPDVGRVPGYGLCDVLRLELVMDQLAGLATAIDERRLTAQTAFAAAQSRWESLTEDERPGHGDLETELARTSYELQLLEAIRAQLSTLGDGSVVVVAGPHELMTELVTEAARGAAEDLVEIVRISEPPGMDHRALIAAASAAHHWAAMHGDCIALTWFDLDSEGRTAAT